MVRKQLRERLDALHNELKSTSTVDDDIREGLEQVMGDIRQLLDNEGDTSQGHANLAERLKTNLERFEHSHPVLATSVRRVVETLNTMGI